MIEKSYDKPVHTSGEASLNISHDTLCSGIFCAILALRILGFLLLGILFDEETSYLKLEFLNSP